MKKQKKDSGEATEVRGLNMLAGMLPTVTSEPERIEAERLEREKQDAAYERYCYRWLAKFEKWARQQPQEDLAEDFSLALLMLIETRRTRRTIMESSDKASLMADAWQEVAHRSILREKVLKDQHQRGVKRRWENDATRPAKEEAESMWPIAKKKGWTAIRMHTELCQKGHSVQPDTVRKWVTALRRTGKLL